MSSRPDILLLVLDTHRVDRISSYGYRTPETTPHLDAFAADATRFEHAVSPAQWTIPTHTSFFTGLYPSQHQTLQSYSVAPRELPTLAERLYESGYFTAAFCNNPLVGIANHGLRRGFQSFLNYSGLLTSRPNEASVGNGLIDRTRQQFKRAVVGGMTAVQDAFAHSDVLLEFSFNPLMRPLWQTALSFKGNTARSLRDAGRFLVERKGVARDQPIFSFVNLMGTHIPYHPSLRQLERFAPFVTRSAAARRYLRQFNGDVFGWLTPLAGPLDEENTAILNGVYDAEVAEQDELVGDFFAGLRASGALDRTLVIVCADHGEHLGEKNFMGHSFAAYNPLTHVPLLIRDPEHDFPRGATVAHTVSTRRIFHTALNAAGVATPAEEALTLAQSPSSDPERNAVFSECYPIANVVRLLQRRRPELIDDHACDQIWRAAWSDTHKLVQVGDRQPQLFDITRDENERLDLVAMLPERVESLQSSLDAFTMKAPASVAVAERAVGADDPQVRRRLHDLGYLE